MVKKPRNEKKGRKILTVTYEVRENLWPIPISYMIERRIEKPEGGKLIESVIHTVG